MPKYRFQVDCYVSVNVRGYELLTLQELTRIAEGFHPTADQFNSATYVAVKRLVGAKGAEKARGFKINDVNFSHVVIASSDHAVAFFDCVGEVDAELQTDSSLQRIGD